MGALHPRSEGSTLEYLRVEGAAASCGSPKTTPKLKMKEILLISALIWTVKGTTSVELGAGIIPWLEGTNPHQPWDLTWMLVNGATGEVISTIEHTAPLGTWWPDLFFCLRQINHSYRTVPPNLARSHGFYACPETGKGASCGAGRDFWCAKWDCVTSNDGDWRWPVTKKDAVKFSYVNQGIPRHVPMALYKDKACDRRDQDWVRIQFTEMGKKTEVSCWIKGLTWGIAYYKYGGHEGSNLTIKLAVSTPSSVFIGPNPVVRLQQQVIHPQKPSNQNKDLGQRDEKMLTGRTPAPHAWLSSPRGTLGGTDSHICQPTAGTHAPGPSVVVVGAVAIIAMGRVVGAAIAWPVALLVAIALVPVGAVALIPEPTRGPSLGPSGSDNPMWEMVQAIAETLNHTNPSLTDPCWLCYPGSPPFYESVGINGSYTISNSHPTYWDGRPWGLTIAQVSVAGTCVGTVPTTQSQLCSSYNNTTWEQGKWIIPSWGWWLCSKTGLTPAPSTSVFNANSEFCVLVALLPRLMYHSHESLLFYWEERPSPHRSKREVVTALTTGTLFSLGIAGAGTGVAALVTREKGLTALRLAVDRDLEQLRQSISDLEQSLTSLSEVVLQTEGAWTSCS
nr:MLV-related proviral Env polyprotein-like isoform X1 [Manis javanica]XP_036874380.1 MLV-related proviral Env polyprotein-like isoform X1 [Manis javanica]